MISLTDNRDPEERGFEGGGWRVQLLKQWACGAYRISE